MKTKLLFLMIFVSQCSLSHSQPGEIDNSFNSSGIGAYGGATPPSALQPTVDAVVYTSSVYPANSLHKDKIIIGGRFTSYNGTITRKVARLNSDGTYDNTFTPIVDFDANEYVYCSVALADGSVIIGGSFIVGSYRNILKFKADGSVDNTFMANGGSSAKGFNALVHALAVDGNKILVGGAFTGRHNGIGGTPACKRMVRLNYDGSSDTTFNENPDETTGGNFLGTGAEVRSITVQGSGTTAKYLVGGFFTKYVQYGVTYNQAFVRINNDGTYDTSFNIGSGPTNAAEVQLAVYDSEYLYNVSNPAQSKILAVGSFTKWNNANKKGIVRLNLDGSLDTTFNPSGTGTGAGTGSYSNVFSIQMQPDGKILLGGSLNGYNGVSIPKGIARLNADGTLDSTFLTGTGFSSGTQVYGSAGTLRNIFLQSDGKIIVSGDFTLYNDTPRRMIARIRTRECFNAAVYYEGLGWDNGVSPINDSYYMVVHSGTLTIPQNTHMVACELEIKPGATLIIEPKASLTVKGVVMNNGTFHIDDSGSLVQIKEDAVNADLGTGTFTMIRKTTPVKKFDFTYWCSPVEDQTLYDLSPETLSDKYYEFNAAGNNWATPLGGSSAVMADGRGYIIRAPQTFSSTVAAVYSATFDGRPHNGSIKASIKKSGANSWNLIGNPYPSAIDANLFLDANPTIIGGSIYLWTHNTAVNPTTGAYQYTSDDYAVYNKSGNINTSPTNVPFNGKIAAGQGFFVEGLVSNGLVNFTNAMRVTSENNNNGQFYRMSNETASAEDGLTTVAGDKSRLWLNLTNAQGAYKQTLVAFAAGATNDIDRSYDAKVFNANSYINFYSISNSQNLAIQGRALPFINSEIIPLGYSSTIAGQFTISLDNFDGLFADHAVYLLDKLTNTIHDLKQSGYSFTTAIGTFDNRFELRFVNGSEALSTDENALAEEGFVAYSQNGSIYLSSTTSIENVRVYDVAGKLLLQKNGVAASIFNSGEIHADNNVLIVKATLENDQEVIRKLILR